MQRHLLGASWASVHGPGDPRALALWTLDRGFAGIAAGPAPRSIDWDALRRTARDLPFTVPVAFAGAPGDASRRAETGLASANAQELAASRTAIAELVREAARRAIDTVVLEPGRIRVDPGHAVVELGEPGADWSTERALAARARRAPFLDRALDRVCRSLFELCKRFPDMTFALAPSRAPSGLGEPAALAAIFEDLAGHRLGYWHDAGVAVLRKMWLGEEQGGWLEAFAARMVGASVADATGTETGLPPGAGMVDYGLLAAYTARARDFAEVVDLDPGVDPGEIAGVHSLLAKFGL
jgi:sugar phosphate isomerase/epimerase